MSRLTAHQMMDSICIVIKVGYHMTRVSQMCNTHHKKRIKVANSLCPRHLKFHPDQSEK